MQQNRKSQSCKSAAAVCSEAARLSGCCKELEDVERPEPRSAIVKNKSLDEVDEEREKHHEELDKIGNVILQHY